jgi:hypothetical protein
VNQQYSLPIRVTCGTLGVLGLTAIGFDAVQTGDIHPSFILFAKLFAIFIFLYVAMFSTNPLKR